MKTQMNNASLETYRMIHPLLRLKRLEVYKAIQQIQPCTDRQICDHLKWTINRITGRRNELVEMGVVKHSKMIMNEFNYPCNLWVIKK